ncbi:ribosome small subunit-dependent GTPase A [Limibacter armeniacum]|uniref:ribosome small subunit-dependent GTPase A n=1 Tax=Limibacter armeniacum TaxID=466084 RepID=UPI002FE5E337
MENPSKESLGWNAFFEAQRNLSFDIARVISEHKNNYTIVIPSKGTFNAQITGKLLFCSDSTTELPKTGDWVHCTVFDNDTVFIHEVLERKTVFSRKSVSSHGQEHVLGTNLDKIFIVQSLNENFNPRRLERYLAQAISSGITPVIILSKADLCQNLDGYLNQIKEIIQKTTVIPVSTVTSIGIEKIKLLINTGETIGFVGSSGVGKSTLINTLTQKNALKTGHVSHYDNKGRHTTVSRELILLPEGGILMDTPGMREFGITADENGIEESFHELSALASSCRFQQCTHIHEPGCAVKEALEDGSISKHRYESYIKLKREAERFSMNNFEKRKKDKKQGKLYKTMKKIKQKR